MSDRPIVVIGAGFAGLSAAVRLARHGCRVVVLEQKARLGGRATAFADRETGELVDNGQHVLLGCYTETFAFLRDIGAEDGVRLQPSLGVTMIDRDGRRTRLSCPSMPPPLNLLAGITDWEALPWRDRFAALKLGSAIRLAQRQLKGRTGAIAASPGETVDRWLERNGQTPRICEMLWHPLALAALNQPPERAAAPPFARVLAEMFGPDPRAAAIALPTRPLHLMYAEPARAWLEARGHAVRTGAAAQVVIRGGRVDSVEAGGERWQPSGVVCAVPWFALAQTLTGDVEPMRAVLDGAARMAASPIVTVNLWFDRAVMDEPFIGLPGRAIQWVFDKREVFGESASHLSAVASGADELAALANDALIAAVHAELVDALPAVRAAALVRATVVREPRATFSLAPGQPARPSAATPIAGLVLAGDWIDTGLPATIESAVRSGHAAADLTLKAGNREPGTGDREPGTGNRGPGTGGSRLGHSMATDRPDSRLPIPGARLPVPGARPPMPGSRIVVHYKELALKGRNRPWFIGHLVRHLRAALQGLPVRSVRAVMGRIEIVLDDERAWPEAAARVGHVFGIANYSFAGWTTQDVEAIASAVMADLGDRRPASFRVRVRRADKRVPLTSPELEREIGGRIKLAKGWRVDLSDAELTVHVEILPDGAFYYFGKEPGAGGMPTGTGGRVACLLSGGIDSPVAAYRMMRRGCRVDLIHFHSYPILSHASQDKVREIAAILARYQLRARLALVPFGEAQQQVVLSVPPELRVVIYRRLMLRIAGAIAERWHAKALVTGEAIGQVASQTLENLTLIARASPLEVLRPLVGFDKDEIAAEAQRIGTYAVSIIPDQDCCTLFTPRHPATRARLQDVERAEAALELDALVTAAAAAAVVEVAAFPVVRSSAADRSRA